MSESSNRFVIGADNGNRTRVLTLARSYSTIKLHLQLEGPVGFEPTIKELQSTALPLGYDPKTIHIEL